MTTQMDSSTDEKVVSNALMNPSSEPSANTDTLQSNSTKAVAGLGVAKQNTANTIAADQFNELDAAIASLKKNVATYWTAKLEEKDNVIDGLEKEIEQYERKLGKSEERWEKAREDNKTLWQTVEKLKERVKKLTKPLVKSRQRGRIKA
mmetsp:Transcript_1056/g.1473  ORF Transcript_1056/g.1473 Transcript_1056/m.1473 type:complete len:149 (-) Transcript_1056:157-603(-)